MKHFCYSCLTCLLITCGIAIVSCNQDEYYDELINDDLEVSHHTYLTRSSPIDFESGQTLGDNPNIIPVNYNECELWAMVSIAKENKIPIITGHDKNGNACHQTIDPYSFPASTAYEFVKGVATSNDWPECDGNGDPTNSGNTIGYNGGAMPLTIAKAVGKETGILTGVTRRFHNYDLLMEFLDSQEWRSKELDGKFMIHDEMDKHTIVGLGFDKKGKFKYRDSSTRSQTFERTKDHSFILMY